MFTISIEYVALGRLASRGGYILNHQEDHSHHHHDHQENMEGMSHMSHGKKDHGHGHGGGHEHHAHMVEDFKRRFLISIVLTIPILILDPMLQALLGFEGWISFPGDTYVLLALSTIVYFYGGWPFLKGLVDEIRKKQPGMMTLIGLAISVAYIYSAAVALGLQGKMFFWELATLIDVMLLGHWIEMNFIMGASRALQELAALVPKEAHKLKSDGTTVDVPVDSLNKDDKFLVKPGERIPVDGVISEGHTNVDESMLTGESRPVGKTTGDSVIGGSLNGEGSVTVSVLKVGGETFLSQVTEMVRKAQESKSRTQDLANTVAFWLTLTAIAAGAVTFFVWLSIREDFAFSMERAVTVMVITCPHALGLAIPLVVAVSTSLAASMGLLIRNRAAFERARDINAVVFDKTGTLTHGDFKAQDVIPFSDFSEDEILKLAAAVESSSEHPIAKGILDAAREKGLTVPRSTDFQAVKGKGAMAMVEGRSIMIASPNYLDEESIDFDRDKISKNWDKGSTVVFVLDEKKLIGAIALGDTVRKESFDAVASLKKMGIRCLMLTGDHEQVAKAVADELGLDDYFAEVLPDKKADKIKELQNKGYRVAMTGDGINDAPALATADLGIAIGAGTDVAVETADVILVRSNPADVASIFALARATYRKMVQNLIYATGYNLVAIPLAAGVLAGVGIILSPAVGAIFMSASTIVVAINARLLKV